MFDFAANAKANFESSDLKTKKEIFLSLGNAFTLLDKKLNIELNSWFVPIQSSYKALEAEFNKVRTTEYADSPKEKAAYAAIRSAWLPLASTLRTSYYSQIMEIAREIKIAESAPGMSFASA